MAEETTAPVTETPDAERTYTGAEVEALRGSRRAGAETAAAAAGERIAALEARLADEEKKRTAEARMARCGEALRRAGLPDSLAPLACSEDDGVTDGNVEMLRSAVDRAVRAEIISRVGQAVPLSGTYGHLSKADIRRLPLSALQQIAGD
ncbi:MAG: hypothetical protein MJ088_02090 [Clostridia bacterium]|nr:hypothetical protein [Clostridia bacterium]